jgi:hypothetical protein
MPRRVTRTSRSTHNGLACVQFYGTQPNDPNVEDAFGHCVDVRRPNTTDTARRFGIAAAMALAEAAQAPAAAAARFRKLGWIEVLLRASTYTHTGPAVRLGATAGLSRPCGRWGRAQGVE